jgi:hypothetical protein
MECLRCHGFMIREWLSDILQVSYSWKCINCGSVTDDVILENRRGVASHAVGSRTAVAR